MNAQWLAGIYDSVGNINRGTVSFNVKNELNEKLYVFLDMQSLNPSKTIFKVRITHRDDIDHFYTLVKPFLYDREKIRSLERYIYSRRAGQRISDDDAVVIIRRLYGGATLASVAKDYNVSRQAIHYIKKRDTSRKIVHNLKKNIPKRQ